MCIELRTKMAEEKHPEFPVMSPNMSTTTAAAHYFVDYRFVPWLIFATVELPPEYEVVFTSKLC
jgi:hypothetical protein